jgi:hypothetical protein
MQRRFRLVLALFVGIWVAQGIFDPPRLFGQRSKLGLSPEDQKKHDDLIRSAKQGELIAYIAAGVGLVFIVAAIPLFIYFDRKKKARKQALQAGLDRDAPDSKNLKRGPQGS